MFKAITVRASRGSQTIPDPRRAKPAGFRGKPQIGVQACASPCYACLGACPTRAIELEPVRIDLGGCVLCGDCEPVCPAGKLSFGSDFRLAATERSALVVSAERPSLDPVKVSAALRQRFGRSLKLRSVSAGGCNACELEVSALTNVNFDPERFVPMIKKAVDYRDRLNKLVKATLPDDMTAFKPSDNIVELVKIGERVGIKSEVDQRRRS